MRRFLGLGFAVLAWTSALATMTGFAVFASGAFPRFSVDRGAAGDPLAAAAVDLALFAGFALPHSLLARGAAKRAIVAFVGPHLERSVYTFVASATLAAVLALWRPLPPAIVTVAWPPARIALLALCGAGWLLTVVGFSAGGMFRLWGLEQAWAGFRGRPLPSPVLTRAGIYGRMRHPLYLGTLVGLWATPDLTAGHALFAAAASAYLAIGTRYEERDLARAFGADYEAYRTEVPALLPRLRPRLDLRARGD